LLEAAPEITDLIDVIATIKETHNTPSAGRDQAAAQGSNGRCSYSKGAYATDFKRRSQTLAIVKSIENMPRPWVTATSIRFIQNKSSTEQSFGPSLVADQVVPPSSLA
jgi:hypothetical protein